MSIGPLHLIWDWSRWWKPWPVYYGAWPHSPNVGTIIGSGRPFHGCIYSHMFAIWVLEVRVWAFYWS